MYYFFFFFFFNDTATTEIYTLSLHDALPICAWATRWTGHGRWAARRRWSTAAWRPRSEEHTSELQSHVNLVCRLLLEKKKKKKTKKQNLTKDHVCKWQMQVKTESVHRNSIED